MSVRQRSAYQRSRLSAALFTAMVLPGVALAQEAEQPASSGTTNLDKVTVTGSRIARTGFVTPSPVTAITAEEIRATGAVNIGDLMTKLPALSPNYTLGNSTRFIDDAVDALRADYSEDELETFEKVLHTLNRHIETREENQ